MKLISRFSLPVLSAVCLTAQSASPPSSIFTDIEKMSADLEQITGLHFTKKVSAAMIGKDQLRKFLEERIDKEIKPADMRAEELTLKMLGLIPQDFDLRAGTVDLLTEQAAAFYDYHKKKLFVLEGDTGGAQRIALVHELAHALADQNFHLAKYIKDNGLNDDSATARMAVMEGQATWLMTAYMQKSMGGKAEVSQAVLDVMRNTVESSVSQYAVFSKAPLYIRESLVFPYTAGILFQDAVYRKLGRDAFGAVFERPPASTQQVIHPEKYLDQQEPSLPPAPRNPDEKQYRKLAEGTLGEFDLRALLESVTEKAKAAELASHLSGSRYLLVENKTGRNPVLRVISTWDSPEGARNFFEQYGQAIQTKSKSFAPEAAEEGVAAGHDDAGFFRMTLTGKTVESIEGLQAAPRGR
ncbi:MAG: hypothetical protein ACR2NN_01980 [Bryobacteraceae bacterium]